MARKDSTRPGRKRKLPRADRERQMLRVAADVFGRRGYHAASMDDIARACGVTKPMLYAYFRSKDGLYLATVDRMGAHLVAAVEGLLAEPDARRRLRQGVDVILDFIQQDRHGWAVLYAEGLGEGPVARHVARYRDRIVQAAAVTLADAVPGRSARQAEPYAVGLLGSGEALARWWLARASRPFADVRATTRELVDGALDAYRTAMEQKGEQKGQAPKLEQKGQAPKLEQKGQAPKLNRGLGA
jgi:AcrR family transcriptional regulator